MSQTVKPLRTSVRLVVLISGIFYIFVGLALLFTPTWFFAHIGNFPPFNRHYMGDLGSFVLPLGVGLVFASANPVRHLGIIGAVLAANLLHSINHIYDALIEHAPLTYWVIDPGALLLFAAVFLWVAWQIQKDKGIQ